jgi:serine/threonine protein kinase
MEILKKNEVWDDSTDTFAHTIIIFRKNDEVYRATIQQRLLPNDEVDIQQIKGNLISSEHIQPHIQPSILPAITLLKDPLLIAQSFVKQPNLLFCGNLNIQQLVLQEVQVYEALKPFPHPNIVQYRGCVVTANRISGICLKRLELTLVQRIQALDQPINSRACLMGIESGIQHLHRHGLIHCDINPSNIMFERKNDTPIIIDFDSCRRRGDLLGEKRGTYEFTDPTVSHASDRLDFMGLEKINEWLENKKIKDS